MASRDEIEESRRENRRVAIEAASRAMAGYGYASASDERMQINDLVNNTMEVARTFERYIEEGRIPSDDE